MISKALYSSAILRKQLADAGNDPLQLQALVWSIILERECGSLEQAVAVSSAACAKKEPATRWLQVRR